MAAARSLLRSSASLLRAAAPARPSSSLGAGASRPSIRRALAAPPRPILRSPVEASFCLESLLPLHSATAAARLKSMLAGKMKPDAERKTWENKEKRGRGRFQQKKKTKW